MLAGESKLDQKEKFIQWEPYHAAVSSTKLNSSGAVFPVESVQNCVKIPYKYDLNAKPTNPRRTVPELSAKNDVSRPIYHEELANKITLTRHEVGDGKSSENEMLVEEKNNLLSHLSTDEKYKKLVHDFETIMVDRDSLLEQLQVQLKVNAELKKLLVATMGDDLQLKMECLTNDKARLAQDIVHYSAKLSNDQENLERINIQCDVWRSKFLASSVMVDELVSWRFFLIRQFEESQRALKKVLEEHEEMRKHLYQSFLLLQETKEALDPLAQGKYRHLIQYHTLYDLITTVHSLSDALHHRLLNNRRTPDFYGDNKREPMVGLTEGEMAATKVLTVDTKKFYSSSPCDEFQQLTDKQAKLMGYPSHCNFRNLTINCCRKCAGEIKLI